MALVPGPVLPLSVEDGRILAEPGLATECRNFVRRASGELAPVLGPAPLLPLVNYTGTGVVSYGQPHGICHARLIGGKRDVTIIHHGGAISAYDGPNKSLELLVGAVGSGAQIEMDLESDDSARPPTQFITLPTGIVIMPQTSARAFFYDGERIRYLGYAQAPAAPTAYGPSNADQSLYDSTFTLLHLQLYSDFGHGRLGTVSNEHGANTRLRGAYQFLVAWVDADGNISPWSARSNTIQYPRYTPSSGNAEDWRPLIQLTGIEPGPLGTVGRIIASTKDTEHAGTADFFFVPNSMPDGDSINVSGGFATIPDNAATFFSDNLPDAYLAIPVPKVAPFPPVRLGRAAFGRYFYASASEPTVLVATHPGRPGTIDPAIRIIPDPAADITAAWAFGGALLVWTRSSTFIVRLGDAENLFLTDTLHPTAGCVGPSAVASLDDGSVMWLSYTGIYRFDGQSVSRVSQATDRVLNSLNRPRLVQAAAAFDAQAQEWRCWVPLSGSIENNICIIFDSVTGGFRRRDGELLRAVCVTQDHRAYMLGVGSVTSGITAYRGAWVLDHRDPTFADPSRTYRIESAWITAPMRASNYEVHLRYLEGTATTHTFTVHRDYRDASTSTLNIANTASVAAQQPEAEPFVWGTATWGATTYWERRAPVHTRRSVYLPSHRSYKLIVEGSSPFHFVAMQSFVLDRTESARVERA